MAGITGYAWGTSIKECYNEGSIETVANAAAGIGGLCQTSWIDSCYNSGKISASRYVGGICADLYKYASANNCYNTGKLYIKNDNESQDVYIGGITALSSLSKSDEYKIKNCYNVGEITKAENINNRTVAIGNISGKHEGGIIENCYYKENEIKAIGVNNSEIQESSIRQMKEKDMKDKAMIDMLNSDSDNYYYDAMNINNGYPILKFQYKIQKGDANGDGKVDFKDILVINKHRLGKTQLTGIYLEAADVTGDGIADFKDILKINKYRLGKISSL